MTSKEISAMHEQVTELFKLAYREWRCAVQQVDSARKDDEGDSADFIDIQYICEQWDDVADYLESAADKLFCLQCAAEEKELHHEIGE